VTDLQSPTLRRAISDDWEAIRQLLQASGLPADDLGPDKVSEFLIAEGGAGLEGLIGLEGFGTTGLLRSLVVTRSARGSGLGSKLVAALESAAQAAGISELWLLTIDAERFFERLGFVIARRDDAPDSIRGTEEFRDLCPDTALLMVKTLAE
jgi:amino-acid N-acetyltransferase